MVSRYTAALDGGVVLGTPLCGAVAHVLGSRTMFVMMAAASLLALGLMATDRGLRR